MTLENETIAVGISSALPELRATLNGQLIMPDDARYDTVRTTFYGGVDRRPLAVARVADATDVSRIVALAREAGLELSIRSGGHSLLGHSVADGGIMLDLSQMKRLEIDVARRMAWAETGLTTGEYTIAAAEHGLATGFGDAGTVGIGGITLGGGIGFLLRKYGMTIDDLLAAEIVTADGQIRRADAETHPDLFWAIRGGGGNFGIATRFKFRLHEVETVVGGMLILPATPERVAAFVAEAQAAPDELTTIANIAFAPPMPFIPQEHHGKLIIFSLLCYAGEPQAGEKAIAPFRALATPLADMVRPIPYPQMFLPDEEDFHPTIAGRNLFIDHAGVEQAGTIIEHLAASTAPMSMVQLRVLGGAMARVPAAATAFAHRDRRIMANVVAMYEHPAEVAQHRAWVDTLAAALQQGQSAAYVNFLAADGPEHVRRAYPGDTWERLVAIKNRYDPTNLFRHNHNIPPATASDTH